MNLNSPTIELPRAVSAAQTPHGAGRPQGRVFSGLFAVVMVVLFCAAGLWTWRRGSLDRELAQARHSLQEFRPHEAIERLAPLIELHPDCAEAEFLLACAHRRAKQLHEVEPHLRRAAQLGWDEAEIDRQFCLTYFQAGDFRRSESELSERLQRGASDGDAEELYETLARGYMAAVLLQKAEVVLDGWLQWRPHRAQAYLLKADVAALAGDGARELQAFRDAVRCDPSNFEARQSLASALLHQNDIDEAAELFTSCLREQPSNADVLVGLAECSQRRGEPQQAASLLDQALAAQPSQAQRAQALALSGQLALEKKDYPQASRLFKEAVDAHPSSLPFVYSLVQALLRAGRSDEAKAFEARLQRLNVLEKELEQLRAELLDDPSNPDLRAQVGENLLEQGSSAAGVNWLLSALIYDPEHVGAHLRLAKYYEGEGQLELAARHRSAVHVAPPLPFAQASTDAHRPAEAAANTAKDAP